MLNNINVAQDHRTRQTNSKNKLKTGQHKTVRPSSRGNRNFEVARCYKSRKNAVQPSSRGNQNFEAARYYKARKSGDEAAKTPTNLTAVKTNPPKYKLHKVRIPTNYKGHKVRIPTKYKGHKVQTPTKHKGHKVRTPTMYKGQKVQMPHTRKYKFHKISCPRRMTCRRNYDKAEHPAHRVTCRLKGGKSEHPAHKAIYCRNLRKGNPLYQNKRTPYGPYNLPHMVLCTKQGPDNA